MVSDGSLHICPSCAGRLVEPLSWAQIGADHWWFELRCPDCLESRDVVAERADVEHFERHTEAARSRLCEEAQSWVDSQMEDWATRFAAALHAEAVYPTDF